MDNKTFLDGVTWGAGLILTSIMIISYLNRPFRKWWFSKFKKPDSIQDKRIDELEHQVTAIKDQLDILVKSNMANLHNDIYKECVKHLADGYICSEDLDNLSIIYESYTEQRGNGLCKKLFTRVLDLPIGDCPDCMFERVKVHLEE